MNMPTLSKDGNVCMLSMRHFIADAGCAWLRTMLYTCLAMLAFASNSILCRLALGTASIDPAGFTALRLCSGAAVLWLLTIKRPVKHNERSRASGSWVSAAMLFVYAVTFSFAFVRLQTGTGALILFGAVQATMLLTAIFRGEHPGLSEFIGLAAALGGLAYLVLPGLQAPSLKGALLMATAGTAWGVYTLRGRAARDPVAATADNFLRSVPFALLVCLPLVQGTTVSLRGAMLAVISGGLASALGYVIWYAALPRLTTTRAALVQLVVPVLAAGGGVLILSEPLSLRLILAACLILGGIALAIGGHKKKHIVSTAAETIRKGKLT